MQILRITQQETGRYVRLNILCLCHYVALTSNLLRYINANWGIIFSAHGKKMYTVPHNLVNIVHNILAVLYIKKHIFFFFLLHLYIYFFYYCTFLDID